MRRFKILKEQNEIESMCIAYGICYILEESEIEYTLYNKPSMYLIESDDFDIDDIYNSIDESEISRNICKMMTNTKQTFPSIKEFLSIENMKSIFNYLESLNIKELNKDCKKKVDGFAIGSCYNTKCLGQSMKTENYKKCLSFLGWGKLAVYGYVNNSEFTIMMDFQETSNMIRSFQLIWEKDGDIGYIYKYDKDKSRLISISKLIINTIINYKFYENSIVKRVFVFETEKNGSNASMINKSYYIDIQKWSIDTYSEVLKKLSYSTTDIDIKIYLADFVLKPRYVTFSKLIRCMSKQNEKLWIKEEDFIIMFNKKIQEIYNNESLLKLAKAYNLLIWKEKKSTFDIEVKLLGVRNLNQLQSSITLLLKSYNKAFNGGVAISDIELREIINLVENNNDAKVVADALLSYGKVFMNKKENKEGVNI